MNLRFDFMFSIKGWKHHKGPSIKPGTYNGYWSGYSLQILIPGKFLYIAETVIGVRGLNVPCTVIITENGSTFFQEKGFQ